jgi:hypothetical protein
LRTMLGLYSYRPVFDQADQIFSLLNIYRKAGLKTPKNIRFVMLIAPSLSNKMLLMPCK